MKKQPLTPTYMKTHAPAKQLLQAKASLKTLLDEGDIDFFVGTDETAFEWAIAATQRNSDIDRFLSGLDIREWDIEQFIRVLENRLSTEIRIDTDNGTWLDCPDEACLKWLSTKSDEWHQKLYSLLYKELEPRYELARLSELCIVRLSSGDYRIGSQCYFPTEGSRDDRLLPRVAMATYASGKSRAEQHNAQSLLEAIGVREVGEREQVEAILKQRYSEEVKFLQKNKKLTLKRMRASKWNPSRKMYKNELKLKSDLMRFISLVETDPSTIALFKNYWIFKRTDGKWGKPSQVYLDSPYLETGLDAYYKLLGNEAGRLALSDVYLTLGIPCEDIVKFARLTGVIDQLEVSQVGCRNNPNWSYLREVPGERYTSPVDSDYFIHGLDRFLSNPKMEISRLMWETACNFPERPDYLKATYRKNWSNGSRSAESQLVNQLRNALWIPQGNDSFVRPAEAFRELLPEGFSFDPGWSWIKVIRFGEERGRRADEHQRKWAAAKELGFNDDEAVDHARWFAGLNADDRRRLKKEFESTYSPDLPNQKTSNPERRASRVAEEAKGAPDREFEKRSRSVPVHREPVKEAAAAYLCQQYTNRDHVMICQACKKELPFKLADGSHFFESVEFLPELKKRYYQNYLALCPNHSAMYRYANSDTARMKDLFLNMEENELEVFLAGKDATVYFTHVHIADLITVIGRQNRA